MSDYDENASNISDDQGNNQTRPEKGVWPKGIRFTDVRTRDGYVRRYDRPPTETGRGGTSLT